MNDDIELARRYAIHQSEEAFETLVSRYIGLVHSSALRQVRDPQLAEEITQTVFTILARKAGSLGSKTILPGWLYKTTRYVSSASLKMQRRRERREQEAQMETMIPEPEVDSIWEQVAPILDEAMAQLRDKDRDAIVLRFFQNKSLREVGAVFGVNEYAAQKRVARGLEKLRTFFEKRGVSTSTGAISGTIVTHSIQAAPAMLTKSITVVAVTKGIASSASTLTLMKGALKIMAWTKVKTGIAAGIVILVVAGTTVATIQHVDHKRTPVANNWFNQIDTNSATGLSMSAAKFLTVLLKQGQLPGFPEGKTYVPKGNGDLGLIQVQIPGLRFSRPGVLSFADTNLVTYPVNRTLVASKNNNGQFIYHYTVTKDFQTNEWQLQRAWRADIKGKVIEEYSLQ